MEPADRSISRRAALTFGMSAAAVVGLGSAVLDIDVAYAGSWGGHQNGRIPASALAEIPWNRSRLLRLDARDALASLNDEFRKHFGRVLPINDAYRNFDNQVRARNYWCNRGSCGFAAVPGTSNHGWALAIDIGVGQRDWSNPVFVWMQNNAGRWGWFHPRWAQPGGAHPEAWHWEFSGRNPSPRESEPEYENNPPVEEEDEMANVITVAVPAGDGGQVYWSVNLADNTKARIWNGTQLDFRRALGIAEYVNQAPAVLEGYRDIT